MDNHVTDVVREIVAASDEEKIAFPEIVSRLEAAGVERYHADLVLATKTFYTPDGRAETLAGHRSSAPALTWNPGAVAAAVRDSQQGKIKYREFCERIAAAGCVGYFVSLPGRRATYYGRTSETHVELFPT